MEATALSFFIACVTAAGFGIAIAAFGCGRHGFPHQRPWVDFRALYRGSRTLGKEVFAAGSDHPGTSLRR